MTAEANMTQRDITAVVQASIVGELGLGVEERVDRQTTFVDLGLDSAALIGLAGTVTEELGIEVPTEWLFDHPTVNSLAAFLADTLATPEPSRG
ncbi:acyl carrier protein [Streptomyces pseudovenezuelae]|uniref:acyl carrier protein n=1 Tax=Streptomyces pseudovenezuelae TaxID=67350 RepID=UPI002E3570BA|nr:acyl carrier protein [Streptomyces pseudovenezuelae]